MDLSSAARPPRYIDALLGDVVDRGAGRFNHLGHWDDPAAAAIVGTRAEAQHRMVEVVAGLAGVGTGATLVDVGTGFGGTIEALDARHRDMVFVGIDIDHRQLRSATALRSSQGNRLHWVQADGCRLPLSAACCEHVLSIEAMWHFPSRADFLAEAARILRPGGTLAVVDLLVAPDAAAAVGLDEAALVERLSDGFAPWPELHATVEDLVAVAAEVGLRSTAVVDATASTKPTYLDHGDAHERPGAAAFSDSESVGLFVDLHRRDLLQVVYLAFERPAGERSR